MYIGRVTGNVVDTLKHPFFQGHKLLIVARESLDGDVGAAYDIAVDLVQAGVGDRVLVLDEGGSARQLLNAEQPAGPVRAVVVGIVDDVEIAA